MSRPRIAFVAASLDIVGGQSNQAHVLAEGLRAAGYPVELVPINPAFPSGVRRLRRYRYVRTLVNQALFLPSLARLRGFDVVHVFSASYASFLLGPLPAIVAGRMLGKRVVLNYHSGEAPDHLQNWGALVHPWLRRVDEIVVPSRFLQDVFASFGYASRVIPNFIDVARFPYRRRAPLRPRLLSTRSLEPHYRVEDTIAACRLLRQRHPEATLVIAGDGSERDRLRALASADGGEGVRFVGEVAPAEVPRLYDAADVFVNSSVIDNQPVSILEAFAAGLPVVSTGTGDIAAMIDTGKTGLIVPPRDPQATASAVSDLLEHADRADAIARRAREEVEKYTWEAVSRQWAALYEGRAA